MWSVLRLVRARDRTRPRRTHCLTRPDGRPLKDSPDRAMIDPVVRRISSSVFVGRVAERARLVACLDAARQGEPGLVLLGGEAGIGKTRLATELATVAGTRGALVANG